MTTYHLLLALHLVLAVFAVGPLVHAATTAGRGIRTGDAGATASASRVLRIYSYASVLVVLAGIPLMKQKPFPVTTSREGVLYAGFAKPIGEFGQTWIWLSIVLWVLAVGVTLGLVVPTLDRATKEIGAGTPVASLTGRVAAGGGVVGLLLAAVVVLMAFQPGR